jgi:SAM-dependent methyltransferase
MILDVGCGTSLFSYDLKESLDQYSYLICVDFSDKALNLIKQKHTSRRSTKETIDYIKCDCKRLPFRNDIYDLIIEKGFLDSVLKDQNNSIKNFLVSLDNIIEKLNRLQSSYILSITDEPPDLRLMLLNDLNQSNYRLSFNYKEINLESNSILFVYYLHKTDK